MASIKNIQTLGNQLKISFADGTFQVAWPTGNNVWLVDGGGGPGPDPGDDDLFSWPYPTSNISDYFGLRADVGRWHEGTDWAGGSASYGNPIPSIGDGVVDEAGWYSSSFGYATLVNHGVMSGGSLSGYTIKTLSAHHSVSPPVTAGQSIVRGDWIGYIGNSGASFGAHLHMELHAIPPGGSMISDYTNPNPAPPSNRTAIDPFPFMNEYNPSGSVCIS